MLTNERRIKVEGTNRTKLKLLPTLESGRGTCEAIDHGSNSASNYLVKWLAWTVQNFVLRVEHDKWGMFLVSREVGEDLCTPFPREWERTARCNGEGGMHPRFTRQDLPVHG
eukprot:scaffold1420_cov375-Pavlova_lutheri.AAC.20